ncbi:MAG: hypothetical protein WDZ88_02885 [Candidatus Paceibacterota bacterium]
MNSTYVFEHSKSHKYLALIVLAGLLLWSVGLPAWVNSAQAASLTNVSDTITDSDPSAPANHTIQFTAPNGVSAGEDITITFPAGFDLSLIDFEDFDLEDDGVDVTLAALSSGTSWGVDVTGQVITLTNGSNVVASSSVITIEIGTHATEGATGASQITNNSSAGTYVISITSADGLDQADTRIYLIDDVVVTASVNTTFTFTIDGVASGASVNGSATTTADTTTATSLPFGTVEALTSKTLAQDLTVVTNARNGFVVTVQQDKNLQSATGADIDGFIDGAYTDSPASWAQPTATLGQEDTYGHWGLTSEDSDLNSDEFGSDLWVAASTTPRQVFHHSSSTNGAAADSGTTRVGYQVEISALQEAGTDYTNTLTYIATPTF